MQDEQTNPLNDQQPQDPAVNPAAPDSGADNASVTPDPVVAANDGAPSQDVAQSTPGEVGSADAGQASQASDTAVEPPVAPEAPEQLPADAPVVDQANDGNSDQASEQAL